jgi:hypothetical protein
LSDGAGAEGVIEPRPGEADKPGAMLGAAIGEAPAPVTEAPTAPEPEGASTTGAVTVWAAAEPAASVSARAREVFERGLMISLL